MVKKAKPDLYQSVLEITTDYLGPAAQRFIDRQIENHLNKEPEDIKPADISVLVDWSRLALALLTEDQSIINEFTSRLLKLAKA